MNKVWRKITAKLLVFFLISSNCFAFSILPEEVEDALKYMDLEKYTSTVNSYQQICNISDKNLGVLDQSNYQNICNTMMATSFCQDVTKEKRVSCEDFSQNEIDVTSWLFVERCAGGLWESIKDLIIFLKDAIVWAVENFDGETRQKRIDTGNEFYNSIVNYLSIEFEKAMETAKGDDCLILGEEKCKKTNAVESVFSNVLTKAFKTIGSLIQKEYIKLGCFEPGERVQRICKALGDVTMPPAFAIGLIIKGPILLSKTNKIGWLAKEKVALEVSPNKRSALANERTRVTDQLILNMHKKWRDGFIKNNGYEAVREKPIPIETSDPYKLKTELESKGYDGLSVKDGQLQQNINQPGEKIVPELNAKLNGGPAKDYANAIVGKKLFQESDVSDLLDDIHNIWMKHNDWQKDGNSLLFRDFKSLPPSEKIKDLDVLEEVLSIHSPELLESKFFIKYKASLEKAVQKETDLSLKITDNMHEEWRAGFIKSNGTDAVRNKPVPDSAIKSGESPESALNRLQGDGVKGLSVEDGKLVQNINQPASEIVPALSLKLNGAPAVDYAKIAYGSQIKTPEEARALSSQVHEAWMKHNSWQKDSSPELFKPFNELTPDEQLKDLDVLEVALNAQKMNGKKLLTPIRKQIKGSQVRGIVNMSRSGAPNELRLRLEYRGEHQGLAQNKNVKPNYLSRAGAEKHRITIDNRGRIRDASGKLVDTRDGVEGRAIITVDKQGNMYISKVHGVGSGYNHSSFTEGRRVQGEEVGDYVSTDARWEPYSTKRERQGEFQVTVEESGDVSFAGEIFIEKGVIRTINRRSGHYRPEREHLDNFAAALDEAGIDMEKVDLDYSSK